MRAFVAGFAAAVAVLAGPAAVASAVSGVAVPAPKLSSRTRVAERTLSRRLSAGLGNAGRSSGALVLDLTTGAKLYASAAGVGRLPASVEKIYTTSTALLELGPGATLVTQVLGRGTLGAGGVWTGMLYLRGGGDPTFGSAGFDQGAYGAGATMQRLVSNLIRQTGITAVHGQVVGDESYFDSLRGTAATGFEPAADLEGVLSAAVFNRGLADPAGTAFQDHPAVFTAAQLVFALRAAGVQVPHGTPTAAGVTPTDATSLASVNSPRLSTLIALINTPSDNFLAEMLLKGLGARFAGAGSSAAGAAVVRSELATAFGVHPRLEDGSGLSRIDVTSPRQVVTVLGRMSGSAAFVHSLAIAGSTGTLASRMIGTIAAGRCRGKTGTLSDVSNLVGYCHARDGHTLVFAFLMNSVDPTAARGWQDSMTTAVAGYNG
jgi:D-alanyl-D-alanine carboxypeptidase/D-alanyl-D-alanine-endopeptidase (penicillin-binding protein 4)